MLPLTTNVLLLLISASVLEANILQNKARMGVRLNADLGLDSQMRAMQAQNAALYGGGLQTFWGDTIGNQQGLGTESDAVAGVDASLRQKFRGLTQIESAADAECAPEGAVVTNRIRGANLIRSRADNDVNRFSKARSRLGGFNQVFSEF